jgi:hypothetical protein
VLTVTVTVTASMVLAFPTRSQTSVDAAAMLERRRIDRRRLPIGN